jgi:tetratricopeptide (TPR) repeat protein
VPVRVNLGIQLNRLARYEEARSVHETARALGKRHDNPTMVGVSTQGIACACRALGDLACARKALAESADALKALPAEHRAVAILAREKGLLAAAEGHPDEARRLLSSALELHGKVAEQDVAHVETLLAFGRLELRGGDTARATELARMALDRAETLRGGTPHSAWVGLSQLLLGEVSETEGDTSVARRRYENAVDHMVSTLGDAHPSVLEARAHLAGLDK